MLPHLLQHLNRDTSIPSIQNAIRTPDPNTIRDTITKEHQKAIGLSLLHPGIDLTRSSATVLLSLWTKSSHHQMPNIQEEEGIRRLLEIATTG
jgi:hypothetical protein